MLNLYSGSREDSQSVTVESPEKVLEEIAQLKRELKNQVLILGHHYQVDDVIQFADLKGDSYGLALKAKELKERPYIVFCGVHFMAETADILTDQQKVLLPDLKAGCSMADMATLEQVEKSWNYISSVCGEQKIVPVTYVNSTAGLKFFVGKNHGSVCTSSNAKKIIEWAMKRGDKLFFFPDQHLGRNTAHQMGIPLSDMVVFNPMMKDGGVSSEQLRQAKVILWYGYCSVHQGFRPEHVTRMKKESPETKVIVHPECSFEVVNLADMSGSTRFLIETVEKAPKGSSFAIGTEINLVNRLKKAHPDKTIRSLSPYQCLCTTMYRIAPTSLRQCLQSIKEGAPRHIIKVPDIWKEQAKRSLETMIQVTEST